VVPPERETCVVVGAGPGGLGVGAMLRRRGIDPLLVERAPEVAAAWRARYDGFRLNTSSWFSYLPGRRFPREAGRWPSRDALIAYYEAYARGSELRFSGSTEVERIEPTDVGWRLLTSSAHIEAAHVVVATGKYRTPVVPDWPGSESFEGALVHAEDYRNARAYAGRDLLVIGPGASGFEIATQLATGVAAQVWLAIRTPPHIVPRSIGPLPIDFFAVLARRLPVWLVDRVGDAARRVAIGDLSGHGLPPPPDGIYTRLKRTGMVGTVNGPYLDAVKRGLVKVVPALERFEGSIAVLADGTRLAPHAVIAATGYRPGLEPLVGHLGVLDERGYPVAHGPRVHPAAPGLHFIGFREPLSGNLRELRLDARRIAHVIASAVSRLAPA
jgi:cation diffusion facilitator CzcD-associated flavoprotein CzcO